MSLLFKIQKLTTRKSFALLHRHTALVLRQCGLCSEDIQNKDAVIHSEQGVSRGGFARAFERHAAPAVEKQQPEDNQTFAALLRNSKFIDLGDPEGKVVTGKIFHAVGDDLYIDFGWKFHCVCTRPTRNGTDYVRGATVRLRIKDLELSTKFLGSSKDLTILEADCQLIGLISSPTRQSTPKVPTQQK